MSDPESQPWYQVYALAMVEVEPDRLREVVAAAEIAIHARLQEVQASSDHHEESENDYGRAVELAVGSPH